MIVFKYKIEPHGNETKLSLPFGAQVLRVEIQNNEVCLWALVDQNPNSFQQRSFAFFGTGQKIPPGNNMVFINTFFTDEKTFVYHAFEIL